MPTDLLTLGPIDFVNFSPPDKMPAGGEQRLAIHKLVGGGKVVDRLGPDDEPISWSGQFYSGEALGVCITLGELRRSGEELVLSWGVETRLVTISKFHWDVRRYPQWIEYSITCEPSDNLDGGGGLDLLDAAALVLSDIGSALGLV